MELNDVFDLKEKKFKRYSREKLLSLFKETADILNYREENGYVDEEYGISFEEIYTYLHGQTEKKIQKANHLSKARKAIKGNVILENGQYVFATEYSKTFVNDIKKIRNKEWNAEKKIWLIEECFYLQAYKLAYKFSLDFDDSIFKNALEDLEKMKETEQIQDQEEKKDKELLNYLFTKTNNPIFKDKTKMMHDELTAFYDELRKTEDREFIDFGLSRYANELHALLDNKNITNNDIEFIKSKADLSRVNSLLTSKLIEKGEYNE